ncbi:hypothetical protein Ancab_025933 [Ancistrocladus abbreviatus]
MDLIPGFPTLAALYQRQRILSLLAQTNCSTSSDSTLRIRSFRRWMGASAEANPVEFGGENAYEILGVSETSSFEEIKASFRKLAKETHPDLASSESDRNTNTRFIQIVAAYEILSDPSKRTHYDHYLLSQRMSMQKHFRQGSSYQMYSSYVTPTRQMEVVEWLKWYRYAVKNILSERRVIAGTGYFDVLQRNFYSAIHAAYYGPEIESLDLLPDRFEAEERSVCDTPEVLHLVSGRDLFGMVCIAENVPKLSDECYEKLSSFRSGDLDSCHLVDNVVGQGDFPKIKTGQISQMDTEDSRYHMSDAYKNLELHVYGKLVATAARVPPKRSSAGTQDKYTEDQIHIFLSSEVEPMNVSQGSDALSKALLSIISGLGTTPEESSCFVYNGHGAKTHVILKHRTLLVKHMHWFQLGDEVSTCECRCTRARLPPSKYWLFEPRCSMHDIGGWYIETFGRDKKRHTIPTQRYWDRTFGDAQFEKRLHPAVYLLALAYRTLDIENVQRRKQTIRDIVQGNLFKVFSWCKKLV